MDANECESERTTDEHRYGGMRRQAVLIQLWPAKRDGKENPRSLNFKEEDREQRG